MAKTKAKQNPWSVSEATTSDQGSPAEKMKKRVAQAAMPTRKTPFTPHKRMKKGSAARTRISQIWPMERKGPMRSSGTPSELRKGAECW